MRYAIARRVRSTRITDVAIIHSKTSLSVIAGEACLAIRRGFYYGVPWRAATTAMLSENTQRAFYGRGVPRPYKALQKQGHKHYFTALTGRTRIVILRLFIPKHHLSVIAGEACLAIRQGFYYGVPWRAATTAMLSENTQRAFYGRGVPRPYKALQKQGYRRDFTALTGRTRIAIIHSKTSLSVIAGEACLAIRRGFYYGVPWRAATTAM